MNEQEAAPAPLRVLIADDVADTRRSTRLMMRLIPDARVVAIAHDGLEAVDLAREQQPDIAIMDINMPELDGLAALQVMRDTLPNLVCIVISAEKEVPTLQKAVEIGVQAYLIKPFTAEQVTSVMQKARAMVLERRWQEAEQLRLQQERRHTLERLAGEYARVRRTDDEAVAVFEELTAFEDCGLRWLMTLAMMYVIRQDWHRLQELAERLEQRA